jgi:hypothetical protein
MCTIVELKFSPSSKPTPKLQGVNELFISLQLL